MKYSDLKAVVVKLSENPPAFEVSPGRENALRDDPLRGGGRHCLRFSAAGTGMGGPSF